jgi:hypothetical protein
MKKLLSVILLLSIPLFGCTNGESAGQSQGNDETKVTNSSEDEEKVVVDIVEKFGHNLQDVSLMGSQEEVKKSMQEHYGETVSPHLIEQWLTDPLKAPGRLTSSPWPDRIDIEMTEKESDHVYAIEGKIVERTNIEQTVNETPIHLVVEKMGDHWLINEVTVGEAEQGDSLVYTNEEYGFEFTLPATWKDYSIVMDKWKGEAVTGEGKEEGPMLSIRHPQWTSENPRQDIPILIFTIDQWDALQQEKFHIGAAPIGPQELNRNEKYVFALPARYNFAFPTGYEEVEQILEGNPIHVNVD